MSTRPPRSGVIETELDFYVSLGKALADPTRLRILQLISSQDEYACTALEHELTVSKSTISHHVKVLHAAGLVTVRRDGKYFFYRLRRDVLDEYLPEMMDRI